MHKGVWETSKLQRQKYQKPASVNRHKPNFVFWDYVLVAMAQKKSNQKLFAVWRALFKITDLSNGHVFRVENIITGKTLDIHGDRLQFYCDNKLNGTVEIKT
jgi:hypothetical protein